MKHVNCSCSVNPAHKSLSQKQFDDLLWYTTKIAFGFTDMDKDIWHEYLKNDKTKFKEFNK